MRELIGTDLKYDSGLEIGCAAGAFTGFLATCCNHLRVIDVVPEAVRRCRVRLGRRLLVGMMQLTRGERAELMFLLCDSRDSCSRRGSRKGFML